MNYQQVMDYQQKRLIELIREVSALNGGDDPAFLEEYIAEVLKEWSNKLHTAITCFEGLKQQALGKGGTLEPVKKQRVAPSKGHGAFRKHYAELEQQSGAESGEPMAAQGQDVSR